MTDIPVHNKLTATHEGDTSPLYPLISSRTGQRRMPTEAAAWDEQWWGLHQSAAFNRLPEEVRKNALHSLARGLLNEAYFIEKSGLAYTAKMVLLAPNTDVAQLYALIGADEAIHLAWIEPFVPAADKIRPQGAFLLFLSSLIEECTPSMLIYLVQVILEGWGIDHYRRLANGCLDPALADIFRKIIKDEALHHRSGVIQHDARLSGENLEGALRTYAEMVRVGPQAALEAVDLAAGGLSVHGLHDIMTALGHEAETARKLSLLKELMLQPGMEALVQKLVSEDLFTPLSTAQAVNFHLERRQGSQSAHAQAVDQL